MGMEGTTLRKGKLLDEIGKRHDRGKRLMYAEQREFYATVLKSKFCISVYSRMLEFYKDLDL